MSSYLVNRILFSCVLAIFIGLAAYFGLSVEGFLLAGIVALLPLVLLAYISRGDDGTFSPFYVYACLVVGAGVLGLLIYGLALLGPVLAALLGVALAVGSAGLAYRHRRAKQRKLREVAGQCMHCGYDLRESFERCPECGRDVPEDLARRRRIAAELGERMKKEGRTGNRAALIDPDAASGQFEPSEESRHSED